jgi:hypothetical protein
MMRTVLALLAGLTFLACVALAAPANPPASVIHALSPEEFTRAGLNKLTPEELTFLEEALARHQQGLAQATVPEAPKEKVIQSTDKAAASFGAEQVTETKRVVTEQELHAHIEGTIESFSGRAVFVLDNGQIWQQRIPDTIYFTPKLENPEVIITRSIFGYKMVIVPANRVIPVKRIQ